VKLSQFQGATNLSTHDVVFTGIDSGDLAGNNINTGDFNNDGIDDMIIGIIWRAPPGGNRQGKTYIFYGPLAESL